MNIVSNIRSFFYPKPRELVVPGDIPATLTNCGGTAGRAEEFPEVVDYFARELLRQYGDGLGQVGCFVAACLEGVVLASHLAFISGARFAAVHIQGGVPRFDRHRLAAKENVALVVDECRNFIRLNEAMTVLASQKANLAAVACIVNASDRREFSFMVQVPVFSLHHGAPPAKR